MASSSTTGAASELAGTRTGSGSRSPSPITATHMHQLGRSLDAQGTPSNLDPLAAAAPSQISNEERTTVAKSISNNKKRLVNHQLKELKMQKMIISKSGLLVR